MPWLPALTTTALTLSAWRLRRRVRALPVLDEGHGPEPGVADYRLVSSAGVVVPPATLDAAARFGRAQGIEVLDLVPADLPAERLLELVRHVDPLTYRRDPLAEGRTAAHALLVHADLLARAGQAAHRDLQPAEMRAVATSLKYYAPRSFAHALAPGLHAVPDRGGRWERHHREYGGAAVVALVARVLGVLALLRGAGRSGAGALALAAYQAQPLLVTAATGARPRGRVVTLATRALHRAADTVVIARDCRSAADPAAEVAARRSSYPEVAELDLDVAMAGMHESRRDECPVCGSTDVVPHTTTPDLLQRKPGRFEVDACRECRTLFQNPRLTLSGLDFYYRDFYDGLASDAMAATFASGRDSYQGRVDLVASITSPRRWLDVGTGQGHFCLVAREAWPDCVIDGLDFTPNVDLAERRGWLDHGYNGLFPELAPKLEGGYDVVSMHHYLEHTRDPGAELDAATQVLRPGGFLSIEVPNPDSWLGRLLKRYWVPLLQPQHQQLIPAPRLAAMMAERGFTVVAVELAEAHQPIDLGGAACLLANQLAPVGDVPWERQPPGAARRLARAVVLTALSPLVLVGFALDRLLAPVLGRVGAASAYRMVAQWQGATDA